jgi:hypothetical protein
MANDVTSKVIFGLDPSEFRRGIQQVDAKLKETSKLFSNLGQVIGLAFAGQQITSFAMEAMRLGDELTKVEAGFKRFGSASDLQALRASTNGLISDLDLMKRATSAGNFGIGVKELGTLLEFAKRRAQETGQSVDYLAESIVMGIGRKSPLILDNLGITAAQLRSKLNGVSVEMANIGDVSKAVGEIAREQLLLMGEGALTASDRLTQLAKKWENLKAKVGQFAQTSLLYAAEVASLLLTGKTMGGPGDFISPGATEPNLPQGPSVFNFGAQPERNLTLLRENLKNLTAEFEGVQIGSTRFYELKKQIESANNEIKKLTEPVKKVFVVPTAEALKFVTKGLAPINTQLVYTDRVLRSSVIPAYDEFAKMIQGAKDQMELAALQMSLLNQIGAQFGHIFVSSFNAAMENGTNFFQELGKALKNYITQMLVAVGVTAALAAVMSAIMPSLSFGKAFKGIAGGTGLGSIFGEGGIIELVGSLKGFDLQMVSKRTDTFLRATN